MPHPWARLPPPDPARARAEFFRIRGEFAEDHQVTRKLTERYRQLDFDAAGWSERDQERGYRTSDKLSWGGRLAHGMRCECAVCNQK